MVIDCCECWTVELPSVCKYVCTLVNVTDCKALWPSMKLLKHNINIVYFLHYNVHLKVLICFTKDSVPHNPEHQMSWFWLCLIMLRQFWEVQVRQFFFTSCKQGIIEKTLTWPMCSRVELHFFNVLLTSQRVSIVTVLFLSVVSVFFFYELQISLGIIVNRCSGVCGTVIFFLSVTDKFGS